MGCCCYGGCVIGLRLFRVIKVVGVCFLVGVGEGLIGLVLI